MKDSCASFAIGNHEVTNAEYLAFLEDIKKNGQLHEYQKNLPDTTVWRAVTAYNEPFVNVYFRYPVFREYPVVGVDLRQARAYAKWLTNKLKNSNEGGYWLFDVPSTKQWIRAARGAETTHYTNGNTLRNAKGSFQYHFRSIGATDVHYNRSTRSYEIVKLNPIKPFTGPASSKSFSPNMFGLYNMNGNVAELVRDDSIAIGGSWNDPGFDIRIESKADARTPSSTIGFRLVAKYIPE